MVSVENVADCVHCWFHDHNHNSSDQWPIAFYDVVKGHEDGSTGRRKISKDSKSNTVEAKKVVSCFLVCLYFQY